MIENLLREVRNLCQTGIERGAEGAEYMPAVVRAIERAAPPDPPPPQSLPTIDRYLAGCLAQAAANGNAGLAGTIRDSASLLAWQSTRHEYGGRPELADFVANFGYLPLMGPDIYGPMNHVPCDEVFFGFSLQAPHIHYPAHGHAAIELYYVIAGTAAWRRGGEDWVKRPPGSFILHGADMAHAMETFEEPLLTFFAWVSDLNCRLWIGEAPPA